MSDPTHRTIQTNGIRMHIAEQGTGPTVLLCHGFPESWYSWRHQLQAFADAGFHAVAPDMRGYGQTDRPAEVDRYTMLHLVGDMVGLLDALDERTAVIVGHDWGALVAWQSARLRPDRFPAVIALSVPYIPHGPQPPTSMMPRADDAQFYTLYFQQPGVADEEFQRDVRHTIRCLLRDIEEPSIPGASSMMVPRPGGFLTGRAEPQALPSWLTEADVDFYVGEFARTGFTGGLNWYRNMDRSWELMAPFAGLPVSVPALYVAGTHDPVIAYPFLQPIIANLKQLVPGLRDTILLEGCGHWTQQERASEVSALIVAFLREQR